MRGQCCMHVLGVSVMVGLGSLLVQASESCNERCSYCVGTKCRECLYGWYGRDCNEKCSEFCWHGGCERVTGRCHQCVPGRHSSYCTQLCSKHCRENSNGQVNCDLSTGNCLEDCVEGRWGPRCQHRCHVNCKDGLCYKEDGGCLNGCLDGLYGVKCKKQCSEGCLSSTCKWLTGKCDQGCKVGFLGSTCSYPMTRHCLNQAYYAEHHTVACTEGCEDGYTSASCNETCSTRCLKCHQYSQKCQLCMPGFYGDKCQLECHTNCQELNCDMSGRCDRGCNRGFRGGYCNETCPYNCLACSQHYKTCTECKVGYIGAKCTEMESNELDVTDTVSHSKACIWITLIMCTVTYQLSSCITL